MALVAQVDAPEDVVNSWEYPLDRFKESPTFKKDMVPLCIELGIPQENWTQYHSEFLGRWKRAQKGISDRGKKGGKDDPKNRPTTDGGKEVQFRGVFGSMIDHAKEYPIQAGIAALFMIASVALFKMGMWQWGAGCLAATAVALFWNQDTMGVLLVIAAALVVGAVIGGVTWLIFPSAAIAVGVLSAMIAWWIIGKFTGV